GCHKLLRGLAGVPRELVVCAGVDAALSRALERSVVPGFCCDDAGNGRRLAGRRAAKERSVDDLRGDDGPGLLGVIWAARGLVSHSLLHAARVHVAAGAVTLWPDRRIWPGGVGRRRLVDAPSEESKGHGDRSGDRPGGG